MTVPTYDKFIEPVLRYLAAHPNGASAREVHEAAAASLAVSDADRQELLLSGAQPIYKNRAGWAHDRLKRAGLSSSPRRGFWQLTEQGRAFLASHTAALPPKDVEQLAIGFMDVRLTPCLPFLLRSSRPSFLIFFTEWDMAQVAPTFSASAVQATAESMG